MPKDFDCMQLVGITIPKVVNPMNLAFEANSAASLHYNFFGFYPTVHMVKQALIYSRLIMEVKKI